MLAAVADLTTLEWLLVIALGASTFTYVVALLSARQFFAGSPRHPRLPLPAMTILKPLHGLDVGLYENLESLCRQQYVTFQIICGVADSNDPAAAVVRRLQRDYPAVDLELVVDGRIYGANHKVSNLINMQRRATHDVLVIADSDIRVGPRYLRHLAAELEDPKVGLATCLYRAVNRGATPTLVESLFINTDFTPLVMVARIVEKSTYAFGATIAIRRNVLEEIGGFAALANCLADDYQLGNRVTARGYKLALCREVVDTVLSLGSWRHLFDHQLRWARTYRICRPGGYFASILTYGTFWAFVNLLAHGFSPLSCLASGVVISVRYAAALGIAWRHLKSDTTAAQMLWVPAKDLLATLVWFLAFAGDTVEWGGRRFRVDRGGEMTDLSAPAVAVAASAWETAQPLEEPIHRQ
jgi:ceramide glucosyltransferase